MLYHTAFPIANTLTKMSKYSGGQSDNYRLLFISVIDCEFV